MNFSIGENFLDYKVLSISEIDEIDPGEADNLRCCFQLTKLSPAEVIPFCKKLQNKIGKGGNLVIYDIDHWKLTHAYYWEKLSLQNVNSVLEDARCYIDSELIRNAIDLKIIRSKFDEHNFLLEFQREN